MVACGEGAVTTTTFNNSYDMLNIDAALYIGTGLEANTADLGFSSVNMTSYDLAYSCSSP
jgi:hypothetical protein